MSVHQSLLHALGRKIRLEALALDAHGQCTLSFDANIVVTFLGDATGGLTAVGFVAELAAYGPHVTRRLLDYNLVSRALGGGRLSLDPDTGYILLTQRWSVETTSSDDFLVEVEAFVNGVAAVRGDLEPLRRTPQGAEDGATSARARADWQLMA